MLGYIHLLRHLFPIEVCYVMVDYNQKIYEKRKASASVVVRHLFLDSQTDRYGVNDMKKIPVMNELCSTYHLTKHKLNRRDLITFRKCGKVSKNIRLSIHLNTQNDIWLDDLKRVGVSEDLFFNPGMFIQDHILEEMLLERDLCPDW